MRVLVRHNCATIAAQITTETTMICLGEDVLRVKREKPMERYGCMLKPAGFLSQLLCFGLAEINCCLCAIASKRAIESKKVSTCCCQRRRCLLVRVCNNNNRNSVTSTILTSSIRRQQKKTAPKRLNTKTKSNGVLLTAAFL